MAVILRTLNVFSPAIPPSDAENRLTVDRTVLAARTAVAALVTLGVSITVSRQPAAGRYAPLLSAAASIGLTFATYVLESSRAKNAILERAVDLFYEKQVPVDVMDYIVQNPDAYHAICIDPRTDQLKHNEERLTQLIQRVKQSSAKPDPQIEALSWKLEKKHAKQVFEDIGILNLDETKSACWDAILKFNDYSKEEDSYFVRMVDKIFDESSPSLKYGSYLKALRSGNQDIINYIEQNKKVAPADFLRGTSGVPKDVKDSIDLETFQLLCKDAELDKTDFYPVWNLILKFNDLSGHALALFDKLLERRPISKKDQIYFCLQYAIERKRPVVVESLFNYHSTLIERARAPDYYLRIRDSKTAQLLLDRFGTTPSAGLLNAIISLGPETYSNDFTQCDHLRAVPGLWAQETEEALTLCDYSISPTLQLSSKQIDFCTPTTSPILILMIWIE